MSPAFHTFHCNAEIQYFYNMSHKLCFFFFWFSYGKNHIAGHKGNPPPAIQLLILTKLPTYQYQDCSHILTKPLVDTAYSSRMLHICLKYICITPPQKKTSAVYTIKVSPFTFFLPYIAQANIFSYVTRRFIHC